MVEPIILILLERPLPAGRTLSHATPMGRSFGRPGHPITDRAR